MSSFITNNKFKLLTGLALVFCLLIYKLAIAQTIESYVLYKKNKSTLNRIHNAPDQIKQYQKFVNNNKDNFINKDYNREAIFISLNIFCSSNNLIIKNFYPEKVKVQNDLMVITNQVDVVGSFKNIVQLAYHIEATQRKGHISSIKFEKVTDKVSKKIYLLGSIFVQNVKTENHRKND